MMYEGADLDVMAPKEECKIYPFNKDYLTCEYIEFTGDYSILEEKTPYLTGEILKENEDERYDKFDFTKEDGTI